jgi:hypothetical protein
MKLSKIVAAAGLTVAMGAFAPSVFAFGGGVGGAVGGSAGAPAVGASGGNVNGSAPSAGQPGTEYPSSAAPVGAASSDYMSSENPNAPANSTLGASSELNEKEVRRAEVNVERDIGAARAQGINVAKALHQKWLGSVSDSKGDRVDAMRHFRHAERDLRAEGFAMSRNGEEYRGGYRNGVQLNDTRQNLNADETSQTLSGAAMHANKGTNSSY